MRKLSVIAVLFLTFFTLMCNNILAEVPATPPTPTLVQATFSKVSIKWTAVEGAASYKVYRNDTEVATVTVPEYSDSGLTPGTAYNYKVKAVNADGESAAGTVLAVNTLQPMSGTEGAAIQQVVDTVAPTATDAQNLISNVQGTLSLLNYFNPDFGKINPTLLQEMINQEYERLNEADTTPDTSTETLEQVLTQSFNNHSFLDVYTFDKLSNLAESHWQGGNKDAALLLYEKSLSYLSDMEGYVFSTLMRIGYIQLAHLNENSSRQEIIDAIALYDATLMRFFDYFPGSKTHLAMQIHLSIAHKHFRYFTKALAYDVYLNDFFLSAMSHANQVNVLFPSTYNTYRISRIASWELGRVNVNFATAAGATTPGTLTVQNVSNRNFVLIEDGLAFADTRTFNITSGAVEIPVYLGHTYDFTASFNVDGGKPLVYKVTSVPHAMGKRTTYNRFNAPVTVALADTTANGEINFIMDRPDYPYNLKAVPLGDTFTLSWDWTNPTSAYQLGNFKVFRGGVEIGTVTGKSLAAIPLEAGNLTYTYTVRAYDSNGNASPESPAITVLPSMSADYAAYYAWKVKYFGTSPIYANDDPDLDGLTNWQEYLLGTNPTVAPTADPKSTLTNVTPGLKVSYYTPPHQHFRTSMRLPRTRLKCEPASTTPTTTVPS